MIIFIAGVLALALSYFAYRSGIYKGFQLGIDTAKDIVKEKFEELKKQMKEDNEGK